jgi:hypothetical protein
MAHGDRVVFNEDFFDQQADDFLFLGDTEVLGRLLQPSQKTLQRLIELLELRLSQRLPVCAIRLLLRGGLFFSQRRHPFAQFRQSEQALLIRVEELVDLLSDALQILLHPLPTLLHRVAAQAFVAPTLEFRAKQGRLFEQSLHLVPYRVVQILDADGAARARRGQRMPPSVRTQAAIVFGLPPGAAFRSAIQAVSTLSAHEQTLE